MKPIGFIIILLLIALFLAVLFETCGNPQNLAVNEDTLEWISPDGIHYWYWRIYHFREGYSYVLAPRYDHDGNLVKEPYKQQN